MTEEVLRQSLLDSNINKIVSQKIIACFLKNDQAGVQKLLINERMKKLATIHQEEKELNIIDYLLNSLKEKHK